LQYAIGRMKSLDYAKVTHFQISSWLPIGFAKVSLRYGDFFWAYWKWPILPNNDILISQRRGEIMLYKAANQELAQVGFFGCL